MTEYKLEIKQIVDYPDRSECDFEYKCAIGRASASQKLKHLSVFQG